MTTLNSSGVDVQIIAEPFYSGSGGGTVPLIVFATASNKTAPSSTSIAALTVASKAGQVYAPTSQRDLLTNYGNPYFWTNEGTPLHGYELNEYGLHAAWQTLGLQGSAYTLRADIDLAALAPSVSAPTAAPENGTYWFDTSSSSYGVFQSNGNAVPGYAWSPLSVLVPAASDIDTSFVPLASYGTNGAFAIVTQTTANFLFEKIAGVWIKVGSPAWKAARPTTVRGSASPGFATGQITINGVAPEPFNNSAISDVFAKINAANIPGVTAEIVNNAIVLTNVLGGSITLVNVIGTALATLGLAVGTTKGNVTYYTNDASYPAGSIAGDVWIKLTEAGKGSKFVVKRYNAVTNGFSIENTPTFIFDSTLIDGDANKDSIASAAFSNLAAGLVYIAYDPSTGVRQLRRFAGGTWEALVYVASPVAPTSTAPDGSLWFSTDFKIDIMVGNGQNWLGYRVKYPNTDPAGVIISGSMPSTQSDGTALVDEDLWLDSSDLENYPVLRRWNTASRKWLLIDNTDQTTPFGITFADARENSGTAFTGADTTGYAHESVVQSDMLLSSFLDPDAPDARTHPEGMLLFNSRFSTYNVKEWVAGRFSEGGYDANTDFTTTAYSVGSPAFAFPALTKAGRWVTRSGNKIDGSPFMGRKAQRQMVVQAMQAAVAANETIRSEAYHYTLIVAPGYPELLDELVTLNTDQAEVASIVTDTPARIAPSQVAGWAQNAKNVAGNGEDGLTTAYNYAMAYYGWGLSTNTDGSDVMVPPSTLALRRILYNDQVGYPWYSPAGPNRGVVDNATAVGYLSAEGEFVPTTLNRAQRDILVANKINPITEMPGGGIQVTEQRTLAASASVLDRVQGARLANYVKYQLDLLLRPYIMEQNDSQTRDTVKIATERFFNGLVTLRAIEEYAVLCDETNNTPDRRARHELWVDSAVRAIGAVEFIYAPVRFRDPDSPLL